MPFPFRFLYMQRFSSTRLRNLCFLLSSKWVYVCLSRGSVCFPNDFIFQFWLCWGYKNDRQAKPRHNNTKAFQTKEKEELRESIECHWCQAAVTSMGKIHHAGPIFQTTTRTNRTCRKRERRNAHGIHFSNSFVSILGRWGSVANCCNYHDVHHHRSTLDGSWVSHFVSGKCQRWLLSMLGKPSISWQKGTLKIHMQLHICCNQGSGRTYEKRTASPPTEPLRTVKLQTRKRASIRKEEARRDQHKANEKQNASGLAGIVFKCACKKKNRHLGTRS